MEASKKPANTAFKQQRLKSWQPLLTPKVVIPTLLAIGAVFLPIGIGLLVASNSVQELVFDYSSCNGAPASMTDVVGHGPITRWMYTPATKQCQIEFSVPSNFPAPVFLYYRLTNFYQNHRKYVKSFDPLQLLGSTSTSVNSNCSPLDKNGKDETVVVAGVNTTVKAGEAVYYPCGLIANSFFTDTIGPVNTVSTPLNGPLTLDCVDTGSYKYGDGKTCTTATGSNSKTYSFSTSGIAWSSDAAKYSVSGWNNTEADQASIPTKILPPPLWRDAFPQWKNGYNASNIPDLKAWTVFQGWMRTAALPTFRKLWGKNTNDLLPAGTWSVSITQNFEVSNYSGTKSLVISTISVLGGKNPFLGAAYIGVALLCWILALVFLVRHMIKPRKLGDHTYLSWNQH